ncbi:hypothetical protein C2I18_13510 [Paenibacillus sp. PK3_47]|uniref:C39 family peptidase n=1 Tax=Paenibacillus sp. PK3_47 TaxID=2072642 RepID=UPI00201D7252|nr:C39 family peptidase [Paenibacillus sp. PK3_47]UQZ34447.1 hypothetical protein C2I18_13510 [Paenibacillus sp. PK3_47]
MMRTKTQHKLNAVPYTQWDPGVESPGSACGPATMAALMEYWSTRKGRTFIPGAGHFESKAAHINYIYSHHGGRPWGMSVRGFSKGIKAYISSAAAGGHSNGRRITTAVFNDLERYKQEIHADRPVALKFDKWTALRWRGRYAYDYHWVLGIGYEDNDDGQEAQLIIHDNGVRYQGGGFSPGRERRIPYDRNKDIISMVALNIGEDDR